MPSMEPKEALKAPMTHCCDFEDITIGQYLAFLLDTLLAEEESFSGKHPFGNSGWFLDLEYSLMDCGYLQGKPYETRSVAQRREDKIKVRDLVFEVFKEYEC